MSKHLARHALIGRAGEAYAEKMLLKKGYKILERNYRCSGGEIDIIACHKKCLCFVEIKTRTSDEQGSPAEAVDRRKRKRIIRAAEWYCHEAPAYKEYRFDVVEVWMNEGEECTRHALITDAFEIEE